LCSAAAAAAAVLQIAAYMNKMRASRLERVSARQDDEILGIVGLYLAGTMAILAAAAVATMAM
jgi:hypothetical protein